MKLALSVYAYRKLSLRLGDSILISTGSVSQYGQKVSTSLLRSSICQNGEAAAYLVTVHSQSGGGEGEGEKGSTESDLRFQKDITSSQYLCLAKDKKARILDVLYHPCPGETRISRKKINAHVFGKRLRLMGQFCQFLTIWPWPKPLTS